MTTRQPSLEYAIIEVQSARIAQRDAVNDVEWQVAADEEVYWLRIVDDLSNGDRPFIGASW